MLKNIFLFQAEVEVKAVDDISVRMRHSFTMGIVGESGCGKTTFARCIMGLEEATAGEIELEGELLPYAVAKRSRDTLRKMQMVFQNPDASLNPQHLAGEAVARPLVLLRNMNKKAVRERVKELFEAVNLPEEFIDRLPHELSGGEKQRVAIARAFAADPVLMIFDENRRAHHIFLFHMISQLCVIFPTGLQLSTWADSGRSDRLKMFLFLLTTRTQKPCFRRSRFRIRISGRNR